jgi:hypothetical protein
MTYYQHDIRKRCSLLLSSCRLRCQARVLWLVVAVQAVLASTREPRRLRGS